MCGIFGFVTDEPSKENLELFTDLCYLSSERGTDSTGIAVVTKKEVVIDKAPIPSKEYIKKKLPEFAKQIEKANIVIGHTRNWTQGEPKDNNNNHPVVSDNWAMIHNGTCSSMDRIKDYKYKGEVDSEILLSHVEKYGLEKGLHNLIGYASVALINLKDRDGVYLWRHNEGIYLGYDRETHTVFFASTESIIENGLANELLLFSSFQIRKLPEDNLYRITHTPLSIDDLGELEVKKPTYTGYSYNKNSKRYAGMEGDWDYCGWGHLGSTGSTKPRTTYVWSAKHGCMIPIEDVEKEETETTSSSVETNKDNLPATIDPPKEESDATLPNKYYFPKQSIDFENWEREGKGFISVDKIFVKIFDRDRKVHFVMERDDALDEKLIDG